MMFKRMLNYCNVNFLHGGCGFFITLIQDGEERKDYRIHKKHVDEIQTGTQRVIKVEYGT